MPKRQTFNVHWISLNQQVPGRLKNVLEGHWNFLKETREPWSKVLEKNPSSRSWATIGSWRQQGSISTSRHWSPMLPGTAMVHTPLHTSRSLRLSTWKRDFWCKHHELIDSPSYRFYLCLYLPILSMNTAFPSYFTYMWLQPFLISIIHEVYLTIRKCNKQLF